MTLRVVIVDDDERFRVMARRALAADCVDVVGEAATGEEAEGAVARWRPDIVLLDIRLPGIGGLEVAQRLQVGDGGPAVILVSTCDVTDGRHLAEGLGVAFLPKDKVSLAAILEVVRPPA